MQNPRNISIRLVSSVTSVLGCALLGFSTSPLNAQETAANSAAQPPKTHAVHFWAAGHILPLHVAAQSDSNETYVPLTALEAVSAQFRLLPNGNAVRVTSRTGRAEDIPLVQLKGIGMIPLSVLARIVDGKVDTSAKPGTPSQGAEIVYLFARVTDARYENGLLRVGTSFPVPFHTRMLAEANPVRGYIECVGAAVADSFRPTPVRGSDRPALRIRAGQNTQTTARIVVELADGAALRPADSDQPATDISATAFYKSGAKIPNTIARAPQNGLVPPVPTPLVNGTSGQTARANPSGTSPAPAGQGSAASAEQAPVDNGSAPGAQGDSGVAANPPPAKVPARPVPQSIEVRGLNISTEGATSLRFDVATNSKVRPIVRYSPGTTQMLVDIPNARLALPDSEDRDRAISHPLISGVRLETIQGSGAPMTRITLDTARILGYSLNVQQGSFSLELRLPRNATGALSDKVIVVDAGHGGSATGATGGGVCEKNCTLAIAMRLRAELESLGARVVMTRTTDADVSLTDRSRMGNEIGADFFVSIHNDSNERSNSASGTSTYYHASEPSSRALAACVQQAVMAVTGLPSRGVLSDTVMYNSGFAVLRGSSMPAVLCEVAYINNQNDRNKLCDPQFQQRVAKAICDGLRTYVEGKPQRTSRASTRPSNGRMPAEPADTTSGSHGS